VNLNDPRERSGLSDVNAALANMDLATGVALSPTAVPNADGTVTITNTSTSAFGGTSVVWGATSVVWGNSVVWIRWALRGMAERVRRVHISDTTARHCRCAHQVTSATMTVG